jgi:hypothetical protein
MRKILDTHRAMEKIRGNMPVSLPIALHCSCSDHSGNKAYRLKHVTYDRSSLFSEKRKVVVFLSTKRWWVVEYFYLWSCYGRKW